MQYIWNVTILPYFFVVFVLQAAFVEVVSAYATVNPTNLAVSFVELCVTELTSFHLFLIDSVLRWKGQLLNVKMYEVIQFSELCLLKVLEQFTNSSL